MATIILYMNIHWFSCYGPILRTFGCLEVSLPLPMFYRVLGLRGTSFLSRDHVTVKRSKILSSSKPSLRISNLSTMNDSFEELAAQNIFSEEIPSEMEVAPCYKLLVHCLRPVYYSNCFTLLKQ